MIRFVYSGTKIIATRVCGRSLAGIVGSNRSRGMDILSVVSVVCCQVEVSASG